ncbi:MAG TPA: hypothetical protein DDW76_07600 [Cyanobacteria bacterium UBA11369]|nr:hypothetical protein [Cyanobacteria bacterium UBA11371]HBE37062.1 hypothetical protein [Cyanobacteria bacterium UBA11368]HBE48646.1 hypothetical protein [Cyanobacteria bacterium UBA11369]
MTTNILVDTSKSVSASVEMRVCTDLDSGREFVRMTVVGSPKGVVKIIHSLHVKRFAEVNEWSPPVATGKPGEVMRILIKKVFID